LILGHPEICRQVNFEYFSKITIPQINSSMKLFKVSINLDENGDLLGSMTSSMPHGDVSATDSEDGGDESNSLRSILDHQSIDSSLNQENVPKF